MKRYSISGAVGLSYGIRHQGQINTESFGYRDYEQKLVVNTQTMFSICSMTKGLVTSALDLLVQKSKLKWETPVHELLPRYAPQSDKGNATLLDFLAMRSGLERYNNWLQSYNRVNFAESQSEKVINSLHMSSELRWKFTYNNWGTKSQVMFAKKPAEKPGMPCYNPFQSLTDTFSGHTPFPSNSLYEFSYGMGWVRTQLPNQMCKISTNNALLGEQTVIGKGAASKPVIAHHGSMPGCFAGLNLFPETESAIVVLTNTTPLCDLTDWMTQLLTRTLFDFPEKVDIVSWVKRTAEAGLEWHARITAEMKRKKDPALPMRKIEEYVGTFVKEADTFSVEIVQRGD